MQKSNERIILITNDDGIRAEGLRHLAEAASAFGKVYIVAPERQCSAMSHRMTIRKPMKLSRIMDYGNFAEEVYSLDGMPADCVKAGIFCVLKRKPDWIFTGMNHGWNVAFDTCYSATVGAAMEGLLNGVPSAAFSLEKAACFETADAFLPRIMEEILKSEEKNPAEIWNVNFPSCPVDECKGIKYDMPAAPMQQFEDSYKDWIDESGQRWIEEDGEPIPDERTIPDTDLHAVREGYISIGKLACKVL